MLKHVPLGLVLCVTVTTNGLWVLPGISEAEMFTEYRIVDLTDRLSRNRQRALYHGKAGWAFVQAENRFHTRG